MDQRRRGAVCLSLGLGLLSGFAWFEASPPAVENAAARAPLTVEQTLIADSREEHLRLQYRGRGINGPLFGNAKAVEWEVDVYRLRRDADGLMPVLVHAEMHVEDERPLSRDMPQNGESVTVCWLDRQGKPVRWMTPPAAPAPAIDPTGFIMPMPTFASPGDVQWAAGIDGSRWIMRLAPEHADDLTRMVVDAEIQSAGQRLRETERRVRLHYDRRTGVVLQVETRCRGHWRRQDAQSHCDLDLTGSVRIPQGRLVALASDLTKWERADDWVREVALQISATPSAPVDCSQPALEDLPDRITAIADSLSDPVTRIGLAAGIPSLHTQRLRMLAARSAMEHFRRSGRIAWASTDLDGVHRDWSQYRGKPLVMGFICRGNPHAVRTVSVLEELRRRFPEDQVGVIGFVTTYSRESAEAIREALGPSMPLVHDLEIPKQMDQFAIGIPSIALADGDGVVRFVHAWQPTDLVEDICSQIEQIRELPSSEDDPLHQFTHTAR